MKYLLAIIAFGFATSMAWSQDPYPHILAVTNSISYQSGLPPGGGLATVWVSNLTFALDNKVTAGTYLASPSSPPNQLARFVVDVNFALAPILAVVVTASGSGTYAQINFQVPQERNTSFRTAKAGGFDGFISVCVNRGVTVTDYLCSADLSPLPALTWGPIFSDANGYAVAQHASDYSSVTLQNPAHPGETIIVYGSDLFPVWPPAPIGVLAPAQPLSIESIASVEGVPYPGYLYLGPYPTPICGITCFYVAPSTAPVQTPYRGLTPGTIGVQQVNFVVPANQQPGVWPLFFDTACPPAGVYSGPFPYGCASLVTGPSAYPFVKLPVG